MSSLKALKQLAKLLPMDEASRMARAKEMGFDLPVFHGTSTEKLGRKMTEEEAVHSGIKEFKPNDAFHGYGIYTAPKEYMYKVNEFTQGEGQHVLPLMVRSKKIFNTGLGVPADEVRKAIPSKEESLSRLAKALNVSEDALKRRLFPDNTKFIDENKLTDLLRQVPNEFEGLARNSEIVTFDPKNIRSKFAKFDPENIDSSDLSAALAGVTTGGLAAKQALQSEQPETEEERWNRTMSVLNRK